MYSLSWHRDSFHNSVPPEPARCNHRMRFHWCQLAQTTEQTVKLSLITNAMMHVWCHYEFRITNMKFASVTRGSTHFQGCFEWDLRQAIFKLILVINCWNCAQTNVMGAHWSVYIGSDYYLNQCSQRSMSPYDVNGSQWLKIGAHTIYELHFGFISVDQFLLQ